MVLELEATVICVDDSEWMRNGDYPPTRLQAQEDAANLVVGTKMATAITDAGAGISFGFDGFWRYIRSFFASVVATLAGAAHELEEAKPPLAEEQRDLRVSDDGEVVVAASPVGSGDDESDAYVASAVSQWTPTAVPAAVARDLLPRFLCSTWWAHLDDGESASSKATARPID
uniref:VWFA domain-containing protein n=1 Tax=Oryza nivara TaxID=4536 RepID=A0A0E0G783_ORYNI